ncbi:hypothetical protein ACP70R_028524 [Stipagrostis hirtigluma subsp. patula]
MDGEEENVGPFRRTSARTRRMASRMASALASSDNRAQAALARLEALESDNAGVEVVDLNDEEYGSTDEEDPVSHAKEAVQDYETQDKARESFGEEGGKIIHGCVTRRLLWAHRAHHPDAITAQFAEILLTIHV